MSNTHMAEILIDEITKTKAEFRTAVTSSHKDKLTRKLDALWTLLEFYRMEKDDEI